MNIKKIIGLSFVVILAICAATVLNALYWVYVQPVILEEECYLLHVKTGVCAVNIQDQPDIILDGNAP